MNVADAACSTKIRTNTCQTSPTNGSIDATSSRSTSDADEHRAPRQARHHDGRDRRDEHVREHLDRERRTEHRARVGAREV